MCIRDRFNQQLQALLRGEEVELPRFNFALGKKEFKGDKLKIEDNTFRYRQDSPFLYYFEMCIRDRCIIGDTNVCNVSFNANPFVFVRVLQILWKVHND